MSTGTAVAEPVQRRPPAAAPTAGSRPDVDAGDAARSRRRARAANRVRRGRRSGAPAGRQRSSGASPLQQEPTKRRRKQVGGVRQPDGRDRRDGRPVGLEDPAHQDVTVEEQVGLPGAADAVDPPVFWSPPPDPELVGLTEQLGQIGEPVAVGDLQAPRAGDLPRPRHSTGRLDPPGQLRRRRATEPAAGRAATISGTTTSAAAVTSTISQRALTSANVGRRAETLRRNENSCELGDQGAAGASGCGIARRSRSPMPSKSRGLQVYKGRSLATATAAMRASNARAGGFRPATRRDAATRPNARAAVASKGSGSKSASTCCSRT